MSERKINCRKGCNGWKGNVSTQIVLPDTWTWQDQPPGEGSSRNESRPPNSGFQTADFRFLIYGVFSASCTVCSLSTKKCFASVVKMAKISSNITAMQLMWQGDEYNRNNDTVFRIGAWEHCAISSGRKNDTVRQKEKMEKKFV